MTSPTIHGSCPGALRPMASGDGLVVRVRPHVGRLSQTQAAAIAGLAAECGNGLVELSSRANVQLRGVRPDTHPALVAGLADLGLIDRDAKAEARRNVTVAPFWTDGDETQSVAAALTHALAADDAPDLPAKFGFAVDCGTAPLLAATPADIRIERAADGGLICRADGASTGMAVTPDNAAQAALDLARWFLESGGAPDGRGRMAAHLARGATPPDAYSQTPAAAPLDKPVTPGRHPLGMLVALAFGQIRAETLAALAEVGPLRVTPWRMLLIEDADHAPDIPGLIARADDPLLRVVACPGAPDCLQAHARTRPLARALAANVPARSLLHVSGCAKGCACAAPAPWTLVARDGGGFDLIRDGRACARPALTGLAAERLAAHPETLFENP